MGDFQNQKFLLKITPEVSAYMPKKDTGYQHFYPGFRFFCSHNRGFTLSREGNTVSLSVGDISLKGFHLTWSFEKKAIEVITDRLSLYPLLVMPCSDSGLWFSNTSEYFPFIEPNFKLSPLAVNHFFMQCYLMPDHFFLKGVSRISGHWSHEFGKTFEVGSCRWQASDFPQISGDSSDPERGVELFAETLARVMDSGCPERFFFSGGLDSRSIVLAAERRSSPLPPISIIHYLTHEESKDVDFQVAKRYCLQKGLDFEVVTRSHSESSLFDGTLGETVLSGLYGGDLLGGCWQYCLTGPVDKGVSRYALTQEAESIVRENLDMIKKEDPEEKSLLGQQIFTHSDRSILFYNLNFAWACPLANLRVSLSPFGVVPFLEWLIQVPQVLRFEYKYYGEFYRILSHEDRFPVFSPYSYFAPHLEPPVGWGTGVKRDLMQREYDHQSPEDFAIKTYEFLVERGIDVDRKRFMENSLRPKFRLYCRAFRSAFRNFFKKE